MCGFASQLALVLSLIGGMVAYVEYNANLNYLGMACMTFNILNFGSPLAGLGVVMRKRCVDTLPLPMCVANLLVSSQWFLYGNIVRDAYIMVSSIRREEIHVLADCQFLLLVPKPQAE
ncbi:mtN3/saliva family protein [Oesophagostomum dentatum]|uniref:Sugar transporter SWEET1 n=1 Tax=Oesophagostomum dentatum TaxID=61180 RepID=A0A0B1RRC6_OESDE|nr:mtN3/saliva family protein [Oesophagostomum dentatum]